MHVVVSKTAKVSIDLKEFHCTHARVGVAGACPRARQELIRLRLFIPKLFCSEPVVRVAGKLMKAQVEKIRLGAPQAKARVFEGCAPPQPFLSLLVLPSHLLEHVLLGFLSDRGA